MNRTAAPKQVAIQNNSQETFVYTNAHQRLCGCKPKLNRKCTVRRNKILTRKPLIVQPKLNISTSGDKYEREADQVAEAIVGTPGESSPHLRQSNNIMPLQPYLTTGSAHQQLYIPDSVNNVIDSGRGRPLDSSLQEFMETRFGGRDFSKVRIHNSREAAESADAIGARAYTVGTDVVFGISQYAPSTECGVRLLAHELAHVVQQSSQGGICTVQRKLAEPHLELVPPPATAIGMGSMKIDEFKTNKSDLNGDHKSKLTSLAERIKKLLRHYPGARVEIVGHTDAVGEESYNETLGLKRAASTASELIKNGVPSEVIVEESAGERRLLIETQKENKLNRRVEIFFRLPTQMSLGVQKLQEPKFPPTLIPDIPPVPSLSTPGISVEEQRCGPSPQDTVAKALDYVVEKFGSVLPNSVQKKIRSNLPGWIESARDKTAEEVANASGLTGDARKAVVQMVVALLQVRPGCMDRLWNPEPQHPESWRWGREGRQRKTGGTEPEYTPYYQLEIKF